MKEPAEKPQPQGRTKLALSPDKREFAHASLRSNLVSASERAVSQSPPQRRARRSRSGRPPGRGLAEVDRISLLLLPSIFTLLLLDQPVQVLEKSLVTLADGIDDARQHGLGINAQKVVYDVACYGSFEFLE